MFWLGFEPTSTKEIVCYSSALSTTLWRSSYEGRCFGCYLYTKYIFLHCTAVCFTYVHGGRQLGSTQLGSRHGLCLHVASLSSMNTFMQCKWKTVFACVLQQRNVLFNCFVQAEGIQLITRGTDSQWIIWFDKTKCIWYILYNNIPDEVT